MDYLEKAKDFERINALPAATMARALIAIAEELRLIRELLGKGVEREALSSDEVFKEFEKAASLMGFHKTEKVDDYL